MSTENINERLAILRQKSRDNTITQEEIREAIVLMREGRVGAAATSAKSRSAKSKAKEGVNSDDLLSELDGI